MGRPALDALDWVDGWSHRRARPLSQRLALQTRVTHRGCESRLACACWHVRYSTEGERKARMW